MQLRVSVETVGLLLLLLLTAGPHASATSSSTTSVPYVQSTFILVTEDGDAVVNQTLSMPQNMTSVTIPLLSSDVGDIFAVDQAGKAVSYDISNQNITVYTLGETLVYLSYETESLTTKQNSIWTVDYSWAANSTLELPYESTILSISELPISTSVQKGSPVLVLGPGSWQVSYGLAIVTSQTQTSSSTVSGPTASSQTSSSAVSTATSVSAPTSSRASSTESRSPASGPLLVEGVVILVAAAAVAAVLLVWRRRGGRGTHGPEALRPDDLEMLRFIRDRGGKVVEAEIRERFSVPRTSAWRQTKRLEQLGYIRIRKLGSQNQLELVRTDFD